MAESFPIDDALSIFRQYISNSCKNFAQVFLTQSCVLCGAQSATALCDGCNDALPILVTPLCPHCAVPTLRGLTCGHCLAAPAAFERTFASYAYAFPLDRLLQALKYQARLTVAPLLAQLMLDKTVVEAVAAFQADLMIAMPLAKGRLRERGFNQSTEIARHLARALRIPLLTQGCHKVRETAHQTELPWKERAKNVRNAFVCDSDLSGKRIIVVDDVMTTGATLNEFALTLRKKGAQSVANWVAARTLPL